jgi:HlyD family secretion protein
VHRLSGGKVPSATELDAGRATLDRAKADEAAAAAGGRRPQRAVHR